MPFFLDGNPTQGEISEAINYLLGNSQLTTSTNVVNGQVTDAVGDVVSYLYKYLYVKYADSFDGTVNFSNTPTNRQYYGLRNNDSGTESTNPADYVWYQVSGGFSTNKFIFYSVTGGRRINIVVGLSAPSILYQADSGAAIDLDRISGSDGSSSRICYAKSASFALASTPTTYQTSGPSGFPPYNTWGGAETWQATPPTLSVNEALFQSDGIYNPVTDLTTWNVPYLSNLRVGALSAITAIMGTLTSGEIIVSTNPLFPPTISGTTMTGSGTHLYGDGRFAMGNSSANIVFNGTAVDINGFLNTVITSPGAPIANLTTAVILNLTVTKAGKVAIFYSGNMGVTTPSTAAGCQVFVQIDVKNSGGTIISSFTLQAIGAPIANSNPVTYKLFRSPASYSQVLNLGVGTYTLVATNASGQTDAFDALGNSVGVTSVYFDYATSAYQVLA